MTIRTSVAWSGDRPQQGAGRIGILAYKKEIAMLKTSFWKLFLAVVLVALIVGAGRTRSAAATTYHTITVDCDVGDFAGDENMGRAAWALGRTCTLPGMPPTSTWESRRKIL
ncbi:MAG: hypothetical protein GY803_11690 [Chloroflexi bacterium]|nr:hypothetical protein [Chloroflexota bacterium]